MEKWEVKQKMKVWVDPIYGYTYNYFLGWTLPAFEKYYLKKYKKPLGISGAGLFVWVAKDRTFLIFVGKGQNISHLAHEATHCAISVFHDLCYPITAHNDEPLAYLVQAIVQEGIA